MKKMTEEQVAEVKRRLALPQAKRVIAYHMKVPLCQVLAVAHSMRTTGRPLAEMGEAEVVHTPQFGMARKETE